jgi:hypothetical protein
MLPFFYIAIGFMVPLGLIAVIWRFSSLRSSIPCPTSDAFNEKQGRYTADNVVFSGYGNNRTGFYQVQPNDGRLERIPG